MKKENEKTQTQTKESSGIIRSTKKEFKAKKREIKRYHSTIAKSNRKEKREKLAELKTERSMLLIDKERLDKECENTVMTKQDLAGVIEIWTGIPASNISEE